MFKIYENDTELSKEYWATKRNHFTTKVTWRIIRKCIPFNTTKRKCYLCFNEKLDIGQNLLTSVDTKTNSFFYGMIARTKSYVFTETFLAVFLLESIFSPVQLIFCIYSFQNNNWAAQNDYFIGEYCGECFLWRRHGNDVIFSFGYYFTVMFSLYVISFVWRLP